MCNRRRGADRPSWLEAVENKVLAGDCLEYLARIPGGSIDLIVTDPALLSRFDKNNHADEKVEEHYFVSNAISRGLWIRRLPRPRYEAA